MVNRLETLSKRIAGSFILPSPIIKRSRSKGVTADYQWVGRRAPTRRTPAFAAVGDINTRRRRPEGPMLKITVEDRNRLELETPMLAMGIFEGEDLAGEVLRVDEALGGAISRLKEAGEITGKEETITVLHTAALAGRDSPIKAERVAIIGRGKHDELNLETVRVYAAVAAK